MSSETPTVNIEDFKGALGSWAAGVTIVTTRKGDQVYGLTVSSFSSLSADPLLVLVCIQNSNDLKELVDESQQFAVSILAEDQDEISTFFAKSGREPVAAYDQFDTFEWHTGSPIFKGSLAYLDCRLYQALPGGDHTILLGEVLGAGYDPDKEPLLYFRRGYRTLAPK